MSPMRTWLAALLLAMPGIGPAWAQQGYLFSLAIPLTTTGGGKGMDTSSISLYYSFF